VDVSKQSNLVISCVVDVCTGLGLELIHIKQAGPGMGRKVTGLCQASKFDIGTMSFD